MKFRPLQDWVLIRQDEAGEKTTGGIYIPDTARQKTQGGVVISVGEGRFEEEDEKKGKKKSSEPKEKKFVKTSLKPGDKILYEKYSSTEVKINNEDLVLVREKDVLGYTE
ncbi:MAG TPA: co-chaperone GroES [Nitrospiria bacterium]|nr:co-chaperone GroES [Nitrospiria bacterium]